MKYTYLSTFVLPNVPETNWEQSVNENQNVSEFLDPSKYRKVYLEIEIENSNNPFFISISQLENIPGALTGSIHAVFAKVYPTNTFTSEEVNFESIEYVKYIDCLSFNSLFRIDCHGVFTSPVENRPPADRLLNDTPLSQLPDMIIANVRFPVDMARIHDYQLVFINGLAHQTFPPDDPSANDLAGIYVKDGGKTANATGFYRAELLDFEKIGPIKKIELKDLAVSPVTSGSYYGLVDISGIEHDLTDCQIILSVGGCLVFEQENVLTKLSTDTVRIDLREINIESKFLNMSQYLDLSSIDTDALIPDEEQTDLSALHSNELLQGILDLSQSFLIIVPKKNKIDYHVPYRRYNHTAGFNYHRKPTLPIFNKSGSLLPYVYGAISSGYQIYFKGPSIHIKFVDPVLYKKLKTAYPKLENNFNEFFNCVGYFN